MTASGEKMSERENIHRNADPHCPTCHGTGEVVDDRMIGGEWWFAFSECHCRDDDAGRRALQGGDNG